MTTIPYAVLLGYAGAVVFIVLAFGVSVGWIPLSAFYVYSLMILSFIAGTHWDKFDDTKRWRSLISALGVTSVVGIFIFVGVEASLVTSIGWFCVYLWFDFNDYRDNFIKGQYFLFRAVASLCAVCSSIYLVLN